MNMLSRLVYRILFGAAFILAGLAVLEKILNLRGYTYLWPRSPKGMLEYAAILLLFVIALLLREIRQLRTPSA